MNIKERRLAKGLTIKALAELTGLHPVKISQIESGRINIKNMTLQNALKLSEALECEPKDLIKN